MDLRSKTIWFRIGYKEGEKERNVDKEKSKEDPTVPDQEYTPVAFHEKPRAKFFHPKGQRNLSDMRKETKQGKGARDFRRVSPRQGLRN